MRALACLGLAVASLSCTTPALAQGLSAPQVLGLAGPVLAKPEANVRLTRLLGVRARASVRESPTYPGKTESGGNEATTLLFYGAIIDLYPLGGGLRLSAGWESDLTYSEALLSDQGNGSSAVPTPTSMPSLTIGYGCSLKGPLSFAVDGGVMLRDVPRGNDAHSPRLTGDAGVSRAYPVLRFSVSRAF